MKPPILFLVFNRPEITRSVFEEIQKIKPEKLFIAADGPRENVLEDAEKCKEVRKIVSQIDWLCEVKTLFREKNLGCKIAVSSAITWFFENIEEGIILEDDCLPDQSFFTYCTELLERYRDNKDVMMINGTNIAGAWKIDDSYFFSKFGSVWGWATWRRAWQTYDVDMKSWILPENQQKIKAGIGNYFLWRDKKWSYDRACLGKKNSWDYQWEYNMFLHSGISIIPQTNLIENIGFGSGATHTKGNSLSIPSKSLHLPLVHPEATATDTKYDAFFVKKIFDPKITLGKMINWFRE